MAIRTRLIRPRQRGITPDICDNTCRLAGRTTEDVTEDAVVSCRLGGLARAAAVEEDVVDTVLAVLALECRLEVEEADLVGVEHVGATRGSVLCA